MFDDDHRMVRQTEALQAQLTRRSEGRGDDGDRGPLLLLELDAVVGTPRRASPSIGYTVHDSVTRSDEACHDVWRNRNGSVRFSVVVKLPHTVLLLQDA